MQAGKFTDFSSRYLLFFCSSSHCKSAALLIALSLSVTAIAFAKPLAVQVKGTTNTQAILEFDAPDDKPCSISVKEAGDSEPVNDVNPKLFGNVDQDKRPGDLTNGTRRTVVVGHRDVAKAKDGKLYSRALQAYTKHAYTVSCGAGNEASGTFSTQNMPLGNSAPDPAPFHPDGFGNYGWPTIDFDDQSKVYIDPQTGAYIKRWTSPGDSPGSIDGNYPIVGINDPSHQWKEVAGLGSRPDGRAATYSGPGGPNHALFLRGPAALYRFGYNQTTFSLVDDVRLRFHGFGDGQNAADRTLAACISSDYGRSCVSKAVDFTLPAGKSAEVSVPAKFPTKLFHGWGDAAVTPDMLSATFEGAAKVSGNTVDWQWGENTGIKFYFVSNVLKAGDKILLSGTDPICPGNMCTIASVINEKKLTLEQSLPKWTDEFASLTGPAKPGADRLDVDATNGFIRDVWGTYYFLLEKDLVSCKSLSGKTFHGCSGITSGHAAGTHTKTGNYYFPNFGFKVWKKSGNGAVHLDAAVTDWATSAQINTGFQGVESYCSSRTVTANYAADGVTAISPLEGRLCVLYSQWGNPVLYFLGLKNGETRKLTNLNGLGVSEDGVDPNRFFAYDDRSHHVRVCSYNVKDAKNGRYKAWSDDYNEGRINPAFTCGPLLTEGHDIQSQIHQSHPEIDIDYFGGPRFTGMDGRFMTFTLRPQQNALAWFCVVDLKRKPGDQVTKCRNTWDTHPLRWSGSHGDQILNAGYLQLVAMGSLTSPNVRAIERWDLQVNKIYGASSTALPEDFVDPKTCEELGVADKRWLNIGATGRRCIQMNVKAEPLARQAQAGDLAPLGKFPPGSRPTAWKHNSVQCGGDGSTQDCSSYLQPMEEGDAIQDSTQDFGGEKFVIVKKKPLSNGTFDLVLLRNANPSKCQASDKPASHQAGWTPIMWAPYTCGGASYWNGIGEDPKLTFVDNPTRSGSDNGLYGGHTVIRTYGDQFLQFTPYVWNWPNEFGGYGAGYGVRKGQFPAIISQGAQYGVSDIYPFAGSKQGIPISHVQSHPGSSQYAAPAEEQVWGTDGRPLGGAGGGAQDLWSQPVTRVPGMKQVYQVSLPLNAPGGTPISFGDKNYDVRLDRKKRLVVGFAGYHQLRDISGPKSRITDQQEWTFCIADMEGECVPGSKRGAQYANVEKANTEGVCKTDYHINTPCLVTIGPHVAAYTQFQIDQPDPRGERWRKLTMMFGGPGRTTNYANIHTTADGKWGVSAVAWGDGKRTDVFGMRMPPWPAKDKIDRTQFIPIPVEVDGQTGSSVRVRFGYDTDFNCTTRREACTTGAVNHDPFAWLSEEHKWQACASGTCTVKIPAISSKILYYSVDRKQSDGKIVAGPVNAIAIP